MADNRGLVIYFLSGEDEPKKQLFIDKIKSKLSVTSQSMDCSTYYADEAEVSDLIRTLQTPPFLSKARLVILKDAERLSDEDKQKLISYLKAPSKNSIFVITTKRNPDAADKLNIAAKECAKCIDFPIEDEERYFLTNPAFKLLDEICSKKQKEALKLLLSLTGQDRNPYEILGLIGWQMRRLGKVKMLLKKNAAKDQIMRDLKINYARAQKIIEQAKNFTLDEIKKAQRLVLEADRNLKRSAQDSRVVLEVLVARLSSTL